MSLIIHARFFLIDDAKVQKIIMQTKRFNIFSSNYFLNVKM